MTPTLRELEAQMCQLVATRNQRVATGQGIIDAANKDFDRAALVVGRKINKLREQQQNGTPPPAPKRRGRPPTMAGLTDDEIKRYHELLERVK